MQMSKIDKRELHDEGLLTASRKASIWATRKAKTKLKQKLSESFHQSSMKTPKPELTASGHDIST
jgi:hypothetical protein